MDDLSLLNISCSAYKSLPEMTIFNTVISTVPKSACGDRVHLPSVQRLGEGVLGVRGDAVRPSKTPTQVITAPIIYSRAIGSKLQSISKKLLLSNALVARCAFAML